MKYKNTILYGNNKLYKCTVCNEEKYVFNMEMYQWKFNGKFCCSYHCYRVLEKDYLNQNIKRKFKYYGFIGTFEDFKREMANENE